MIALKRLKRSSFSGDAAKVEALLSFFEQRSILHFHFIAKEPGTCRYEIRIQGRLFRLWDRHLDIEIGNKQKVQTKTSAEECMLEALCHIWRWERIAELQDPDSEIDPADLKLRLTTQAGNNDTAFTEEQLRLDLPMSSSRSISKTDFKIELINQSDEEVHGMLLKLDRTNYAIEVADVAIPFPANQTSAALLTEETRSVIDSNNAHGFSETIFLLLLSTHVEDLDQSHFKLPGISKIFEVMRGPNAAPRADLSAYVQRARHWLTKRIIVTSHAEVATLSEQDVYLPRQYGGMMIKGHQRLRGRAILRPALINTKTHDADSVIEGHMRQFKPALINFAGRGQARKDILELTHLENIEEVTSESPLVIQLTANIATDEKLLAMTLDGNEVVPAGNISANERQFELTIPRLPDADKINHTLDVGYTLPLMFYKVKREV